MLAVRIHAYGDPSVLRLDQIPVPAPGAGELLVRVVAASVNPVDWKIREGMLANHLPHALPLTLGWDFSGIVVATGIGATRFAPGAAVFARPDIVRDGSYAEYIVVRETEAAAKPSTISHVEAATLPLAGITAWEAIVAVGKVAAGQRVLIHAGAGGVGSLAIQLAKWNGAHVIATASAANLPLVRALGADEAIDYRATPFERAARDVDLVFDTIGGATQDRSWSVLKRGGLLVSITTPPDKARANAEGKRSAYVFIQPDAAVLAQLAELVDSCNMRPVVGAEFALADVARAHELSQSGRARGKIALYVGQP